MFWRLLFVFLACLFGLHACSQCGYTVEDAEGMEKDWCCWLLNWGSKKNRARLICSFFGAEVNKNIWGAKNSERPIYTLFLLWSRYFALISTIVTLCVCVCVCMCVCVCVCVCLVRLIIVSWDICLHKPQLLREPWSSATAEGKAVCEHSLRQVVVILMLESFQKFKVFSDP